MRKELSKRSLILYIIVFIMLLALNVANMLFIFELTQSGFFDRVTAWSTIIVIAVMGAMFMLNRVIKNTSCYNLIICCSVHITSIYSIVVFVNILVG